ncbi:MAG: replication initiator protein A [Oribacterium sp.]|nr:replication initiator protein A [Oribacterium sp.]
MARGYFYRGQSEQFIFYRTPKVLYTEPEYANLSIPAKALYGILLDRESLSDKSGWVDDHGRIYVYMTNRSICNAMHISDKTATKLLVELENIDLIQRVRQGQGRPTRIYVKNFMDTESLRFLNRKDSDSGLGDNPGPGSENIRCNNTEMINTEYKDTDLISSKDKKRTDERLRYRQYFMKELDINTMRERYPYDNEAIDEILELILDTVCSTRQKIGIAGEQRPIEIVKNRFMKLDSGHLEFVLQGMSDNTTLIRNMKQYLLAALYNAPLTINNYYKSLAKHDMATGKV